MRIQYSSNNSGGRWWLTDDNWRDLEAAGWDVGWFRDMDATLRVFQPDEDGRWLGALASKASKECDDPDQAIAEFERITGQIASDIGCTCCGPPHEFSYQDDAGRTHWAEFQISATQLTWA